MKKYFAFVLFLVLAIIFALPVSAFAVQYIFTHLYYLGLDVVLVQN